MRGSRRDRTGHTFCMSAREERKPRVVCTACRFAWYSTRMAEGLLLMTSCPRCGGALEFGGAIPSPVDEDQAAERFTPPHLALGLPRPRPR